MCVQQQQQLQKSKVQMRHCSITTPVMRPFEHRLLIRAAAAAAAASVLVLFLLRGEWEECGVVAFLWPGQAQLWRTKGFMSLRSDGCLGPSSP